MKTEPDSPASGSAARTSCNEVPRTELGRTIQATTSPAPTPPPRPAIGEETVRRCLRARARLHRAMDRWRRRVRNPQRASPRTGARAPGRMKGGGSSAFLFDYD